MGLNLKYEEGQTPIAEGEKKGLKIRLVSTQKELNEFEQLNIEKAFEWIIRSKLVPSTILTEEFIKTVHEKMYEDVWTWAGKFRKSQKNIGVDWKEIPIHLRNLIEDTKFWIDQQTFIQEEIAIRFKHRLVSIHCFPNGNGRHSRIMADIIMESIFKKPPFNWHKSCLIKGNHVRKKYIRSLKEADNGNIKPLINFALV